MNSSEENSRHHTRKSDIIVPYRPQDKQTSNDSYDSSLNYLAYNDNSKQSQQKRESNNTRNKPLNQEFDNLQAPLSPMKSHQNVNQVSSRDDAGYSIDSVADELRTTKLQFQNLRRWIIAVMIFNIFIFGVQLSFFGVLINNSNANSSCSSKYALSWIIEIFGAFGILFGFWGLLSHKITDKDVWRRKAVMVGTGLTISYFACILAFAIVQSDDWISYCSQYRTNSLLSYTLLSSILIITLFAEICGVSLLWKLNREVERIKVLEHSEQSRAELISQVARDLAAP